MTDQPPPENQHAPLPRLTPPPQNEPSPQPPISEPNFFHWLFLGKNGIRAGWSLVIFVALMIGTLVPIAIVIAIWHPNLSTKEQPVGQVIALEFMQLILVVVPTILMAVIEKKRILSYGFIDRRALGRFAGGLCVGFVAVTVLVGLLWASGLLAFDRLSLHGFSIVKYGLLWGVAFLLVALFEESFFRGYPQYTLARGLNFWWAAILMSIFFGVSHMSNSGENWIGIVDVICAGAVLVLSLRLTGSLLWAVGMHAGWDWAQSYFYGVADSGMAIKGHLLATHPTGSPFWNGGAAGPEGSPFALLMEILMAIGLYVWWKRQQKLPVQLSNDDLCVQP